MCDTKSQYKLESYLSIQFRYQLQLGGKGPGSAGGQLSLSGAEESTETEDGGQPQTPPEQYAEPELKQSS